MRNPSIPALPVHPTAVPASTLSVQALGNGLSQAKPDHKPKQDISMSEPKQTESTSVTNAESQPAQPAPDLPMLERAPLAYENPGIPQQRRRPNDSHPGRIYRASGALPP